MKQLPGSIPADLDPGLRSRIEYLSGEVQALSEGTQDVTALPANVKDYDGDFVRVRKPGVADKLYWKARNANGSFGWVEIGSGT